MLPATFFILGAGGKEYVSVGANAHVWWATAYGTKIK